MIIRDLAEWAAPWNNFNYPINVYPAGSYGYSVSAPAEGEGGTHDGETPVTVNYPAGLGTSVSANFKDSGGVVTTHHWVYRWIMVVVLYDLDLAVH